MAKRTEEATTAAVPGTAPFPKMLTLDEVQEILNLGKPLVYALVKSGELRAAQFGGRGIWRVRQDDLAAYIDAAYEKTAERIAAGQIPESDAPADD
ncbi:helix-turn-helix domain-containing protein [Pseudarthrobacter sp. R1]|uniref:helix-turn-helix domain-containing protein n=1 Tax=Pseudarthrobacter sp. R1 TaxID=2944934 RepID=UPI002108A18E|nr:helix-turn-helix domain-containing protein [Pseudarthrobacter sp. R1]MCQ6270992.1 helix-turn-helix domain-containing protein [Pseudarthrobacter sp. R1]